MSKTTSAPEGDWVQVRERALEELAGPQGNRHKGNPTPARKQKLEVIKSAAVRLFYADGYTATDIRRIAEVVDMHPSTLYNYFSSKEGLLYLIMKDALRDLTASFDAAFASSSDPTEQLRAALEAHLLLHMRRRYRAWVAHVELRALTGDYLEDIRSMRQSLEAKWISLLKRGMDQGSFEKSDPRITAYGLLSIGEMSSRWHDPDGPVPAENVASTLVNVVLGGVLRRG